MAPVLSRSLTPASVSSLPLFSSKTNTQTRLSLRSAFLHQNGFKSNSFSCSGLKWKVDKRGSSVVVRCEASAVAEKEAPEASGEKHEYQAEENKDIGNDNSLIGQFGVGFYSAFLVAEKVIVSTNSPKSDKQYTWEAAADSSSYVIREETDPEKQLRHGTEITLYLKDSVHSIDPLQRLCALEEELALLLRISHKYGKSGAQILFSMGAFEHIASCMTHNMQIKGNLRRFDTSFGKDSFADVHRQRMVISPSLRLVFSLTSLVESSDFFEVKNKVVREVIDFVKGHQLLFDQVLRQDVSDADELAMEQINLVVGILSKVWPYEEGAEYGFVQGLFGFMYTLFSHDNISFFSPIRFPETKEVRIKCVSPVL